MGIQRKNRVAWSKYKAQELAKQKQVGFIVYGTLAKNEWIRRAKAAGHRVVLRRGYCELWK